jgi:[methyl-Co(III) methanol-specific corrinoid protein]:coenzyme M methyltransferase
MSRELFLQAIQRRNTSGRLVFGSATSVVCQELMQWAGATFPQGHTDPQAMFRLALAGHTLLGFDVVMPLFSVCHEASAMGCNVNWGGPDMMPESGKPIYQTAEDIHIPADLLTRPGCAVPLQALAMLRKELGGAAAVCGKVFGGWTQAYHYFGLESFLIRTITEPDEVKRILEKLLPVTIQFAKAQLDAGADCILVADHATRDLCSPRTYETFLLDLHARLAESIPAPVLLHICGSTVDRIGMIARTGMDCFHWDTKSGAAGAVRKLAGEKMALMGGINNIRLLQGTPEEIAAAACQAAQSGIDVIGPECAIPLATPLVNLQAITSIGRERYPYENRCS